MVRPLRSSFTKTHFNFVDLIVVGDLAARLAGKFPPLTDALYHLIGTVYHRVHVIVLLGGNIEWYLGDGEKWDGSTIGGRVKKCCEVYKETCNHGAPHCSPTFFYLYFI